MRRSTRWRSKGLAGWFVVGAGSRPRQYVSQVLLVDREERLVAPFAFHRAGRNSAVLIAVAAAGYASIVARFVFAGAHWPEWPSIALIFAFVCWIGWMGVSWNRPQSLESRGRMVGALKHQISR